MDSWIIDSEKSLDDAIDAITRLSVDGKFKVSITKAGSKSTKQRGLQWRWNNDVAKSGIGGDREDTDRGVHYLSKWRFAIPIFCRDDSFFNDLYAAYMRKWGKDQERVEYFVNHHVHTEDFNVEQMAEFLTTFQQYYIGVGVSLTEPPDKSLLSYEKINYVS